MRLKEFSPRSKDPDALQAFHFERNIGTVEDPVYVYDSYQEDDANLDIDSGALKILKKKVFDGVAFLAVRTDKIQIWWKRDTDANAILIAEAELVGQVWDVDQWRDRTFQFDGAELTKVNPGTIDSHYRAFRIEDIPALSIVDAVWGLDLWWDAFDVKFAFYGDAPGKSYRTVWQTRVMDAALAWTDNTDPENPVHHKGLNFSVKDYIDQTIKIENESLGTSTDGIYSGILQNFPIGKIEKPKENGKLPESYSLDKDTGVYTIQFDRTVEDVDGNPIEDNTEYEVFVDYEYFPNSVNHTSGDDPEAGWTWHRWIFDPDGFTCPVADVRTPAERFADKAGLYVDPYLIVDEQSTYIDVTCDGYVLRATEAVGNYFALIYDPDSVGSSEWVGITNEVDNGANYHGSGRDTNFTVELIENAPHRVVIRCTGNYYDDGGASYLTNSVGFTLYFYIYSDKFFLYRIWETDGVIDLSGDDGQKFGITERNITSMANIGGDAGTEYCHTGAGCGNETDLLSIARDDYEYIAFTSTEMNCLLIQLYRDSTDSNHQIFGGHGALTTQQFAGNSAVTAGTYRDVQCVIIDSADRDGGKAYTSANRLSLGNQYKDFYI